MPNQEIAELPVAEKLRLMECLWDSLSHEGQLDGAVPSWHADVLAGRARLLASGEESSSPWSEVKARLQNQTRAA